MLLLLQNFDSCSLIVVVQTVIIIISAVRSTKRHSRLQRHASVTSTTRASQHIVVAKTATVAFVKWCEKKLTDTSRSSSTTDTKRRLTTRTGESCLVAHIRRALGLHFKAHT